jgi:hypothetical protein
MGYMKSWPPKPQEILLEIVRAKGWSISWEGWQKISVTDKDGNVFKLWAAKKETVAKEAEKMGLRKQYEAALFAFGIQ